jgi:hypothetical protein
MIDEMKINDKKVPHYAAGCHLCRILRVIDDSGPPLTVDGIRRSIVCHVHKAVDVGFFLSDRALAPPTSVVTKNFSSLLVVPDGAN